MGIIVIVGLVACALASLARPWIGVAYAYLVVVLSPQDIWFWDFQGIRPEFWVILTTIIGVAIGFARGAISLKPLKRRRNLYVLVLWACVIVSYYFGPFTHVGGPFRFDNPDLALVKYNKIFVLYFIACLCVNDERKTHALFFVMVASVLYLVYWANLQAHTGHYFGRLNGPVGPSGQGNYQDQNNFAMLFVVGQPFLLFWGASQHRPLVRWAIWATVPFAWNAVFLTGSRGGLLGLGVTTFLIAVRSKRRGLMFLFLLPALVIAFVWKGGPVMQDRATTIVHYQHNASAEGRLESWRAALRMIAAHPLTGVGLASYGPAFPHYSDQTPREAHDTVLQTAAESGVIAGLMYLLITAGLLRELWLNGRRLKDDPAPVAQRLFIINEATFAGFSGLIVCSIFLSLQQFEIFYLLNVIGSGLLYASDHYFIKDNTQTAAVMRAVT